MAYRLTDDVRGAVVQMVEDHLTDSFVQKVKQNGRSFITDNLCLTIHLSDIETTCGDQFEPYRSGDCCDSSLQDLNWSHSTTCD